MQAQTNEHACTKMHTRAARQPSKHCMLSLKSYGKSHDATQLKDLESNLRKVQNLSAFAPEQKPDVKLPQGCIDWRKSPGMKSGLRRIRKILKAETVVFAAFGASVFCAVGSL